MATPTKKTMFNYFTKLPSKASIIEENPRKATPIFNKQHVEEFQNRREQFEVEVFGDTKTETSYLIALKSDDFQPFRILKRSRGSLRARLFQFCEDVRPPYFGTWQKASKLVTGRRPFKQDNELFDYEVDSEAEWDIGGPGESLKGDDSEDEEELDDYEIDMKTFVPHGYVSDDEIDVHSDNEENPSANQSIEEGDADCDMDENSGSSIKIIGEVKMKNNEQQQITPSNQNQMAPPPPPIRQTPKMDIKPITLGLSFEENPSISEAKLQFLKAFQGVSCN